MTYIIDYQTGVTETFDGTLDEAKAAADEGIAYTGENVYIRDMDQNEVAFRRWYGVYNPDDYEDDADIIAFGDYGHYAPWYDM